MNGIDYLLDVNARHSQEFKSPKTFLDRKLYREKHPLEISALKCMDGRLHLPKITKTALGIIQPWRNVGGKFDLGWTGFKESISGWVEYSIGRERSCLVIATYHFSRGDKHRGCAGFNYDTDAARASALALRNQFQRVFGNGNAVYPIMVGIETDLDALILHGDDESRAPVDLAAVTDASEGNLQNILRDLYPAMPAQIMRDFIPLVSGNIENIRETKATNRPAADTLHKEWVLAVGRGFDWLHEANTAIIVGPFDPELRLPIATAARLLLSNLNEGRIPKEDGVVLMSSAPYRELAGYDRPGAEEKAKWVAQFALKVITEETPELLLYLKRLTATMDINTRELNVLERTDK